MSTASSRPGLAAAADTLSRHIAWLARQAWLRDGAGVLILIALAAYSLNHGFDLSILVNADGIQPIHSQFFPVLQYRPPPSNNFFPDGLLHLLAAPVFPDPLIQKLVVGWAIIIATLVLAGLTKGLPAMLGVFGLYALTGFGFVDSASHFALPLLVLLYQLSRTRLLRNLVLVLAVFSDALVVLPLLVLCFDRDADRHWPERLALMVLAGFAGEVLYSEFSLALVKIGLAAPAFLVAILLTRRLGLLPAMLMGLVVVLPLAGLTGALSPRYAIPVAASLLLVLVPTTAPRFNWRILALPALALLLFSTTLDRRLLDLVDRQFDCLLAELSARQITTIAADHWTAKPLWFAARAQNVPLTITQVDFAANATSLWMAPYEFAGAPTPYAVRSQTYCAFVEDPAQFCSQDSVAPILSRTALCEGLELFHYASTVPARYSPPPANKLASIAGHFWSYLDKAGLGDR